MPVDWEKIERDRSKPLVMVLTRYLPHFRREIFERLSRIPDLQFVFLHTAEIPKNETGITTEPLANSHLVRLDSYQVGPLLFYNQPESAALVAAHDPDVIVCEAAPTFVSIGRSARRQRRRGQGVIFWTKGASPKKRKNALLPWVRDRMMTLWLRQSTVLIGYGRSSEQYFNRLGFSSDRIVIAQNTIDTTTLFADPDMWRERGIALRNKLGLAGRTIVGTVGRVIEGKRVDLAVDAVAELSRDFPNLSLVVGGDGPALDDLRRRAAEYPRLDAHFLGRLPKGGDNEVFAAADLNVFCSRVGLAIVQSMALGKPTIIADEPNADAELVVAEETGLRFPVGDSAGLAAQIRRVLEDPALAARLSATGRANVVENATIENMVSRIEEAVRLALRTRRRVARDPALVPSS